MKKIFQTLGLPALVFITAIVSGPSSGNEAPEVRPQGTRGQAMMLAPAGEFKMGCNRGRDGNCDPDELPYHTVYLEAFYMDRTEVTNAQYRECVAAEACRPAREYKGFAKDDQPVVGVSWDDAEAYCQWARKRLPAEAEWEKAARGSDGRVFPWGNQTCGCECAVQENKAGLGCGRDATWPVGSAQTGASPYGLLDMAGNVWEWTADWYDEKYYRESPLSNPRGPQSGQAKVRRGGSFANVKNYLRTSDRNYASPETVSNSTGFRCALTAPPADQ